MNNQSVCAPQGRVVQGFLNHRSHWNENVASEIAEKEGISLTPQHWKIIHILRTEFYANSGILGQSSDRCGNQYIVPSRTQKSGR